jgi:hypothetical protein
MHKYYVHVLASLLSGSHNYEAYVIRRPFPPYATHYALLLGFTKFWSFDVAEKVLVCLIFVSTAYGFRYCARSLGPSGGWLSVCMVPLVLHWPIVMGFLNYSLAIGLFFWATGLWVRAAARPRLWVVFGLAAFLLALTHPVPLLLLIVFCSLDLFRRLMQRLSLADCRWQLLGLGIAGLSLVYPLLSVDRSRSVSNLYGFGFHLSGLIGSLALDGISPFDTRSKNLVVNFYRLELVALLVTCLLLAAVGFRGRWLTRRLQTGDTMLVLSVMILLAIPVLPPSMNGSDFFSQRLMIVAWLGAIAAAGGYRGPWRLRRVAPGFAVVLAFSTLWPAELFFRPVARQLEALENQRLPEHVGGLAILDPAMLKAVRVEHQLGFNPYLWSGVLPFIHADDVMLNSPFMDLKISPLMAAEGSELLVNQMRSADQAERLINGNVDLPALDQAMRTSLLASTGVVVFVGVPGEVERGLAPLIGDGAASGFVCDGHTWYLVCSLPAR